MLTDEIALVTLPSGEVLMQTIPTDQQGYAYVELDRGCKMTLATSLASDALLLVDLTTGSVLVNSERR
jgi:hypothetical protein